MVNIAESWVGMRVVRLLSSGRPSGTDSVAAYSWTDTNGLQLQGGDSYQSAFYVFEEMAQTPSSTSSKSLISQAVSELHLGRLPEAEAALNQALQNEPKDIEAIANAVVLATLMGKSTEQQQYLEELKTRQADHALLTDLEEKSSLFDQAAGKYSAKVSS